MRDRACGFRLARPVPTSILTSVVLASNLGVGELSGTLPSALGSLTQLTYLELSRNKFSGGLPDSIGNNLLSLTLLLLYANNLSGTIPDSLSSLTALTTLFLAGSGNKFSGSIPNSICLLVNLLSLCVLDRAWLAASR